MADSNPRRPPKSRSATRLILFTFLIAVLLFAAWVVRHALLVIYVSAVFAVVLEPAVEWLHRRAILGWHPSRGMAIVILVGLLIVVLGGLVAVAIPSLAANAAGFANSMGQQIGALRNRLHSIPVLRNIDFGNMQPDIPSRLAKVVPAIGGTVTSILTGILLIAYFILDGGPLLRRTLKIAPPEERERLQRTLSRAGDRMRRWLAGQAMLMAILGSASAVTFGIMGLPYFYLLAIFAGVANIVPLLGPLVTVIVASAVAATQSWWKVLGVVIFYLIYQQIENAFLTPNIMKSQVQLSSAVVVIALLIGGELAGIPGALVAVPSAVLIGEIAQEYLVDHE